MAQYLLSNIVEIVDNSIDKSIGDKISPVVVETVTDMIFATTIVELSTFLMNYSENKEQNQIH
jgi:hypothetical protein